MPVTWSFYGKTIEANLRRAFADLGMIPESASAYPDEAAQRFLGIFSGRIAINVTVGRILFSGLPTVSGDDVERDMLGAVRPGVIDDAYPGRLLPILTRAPQRILASGRAASNLHRETTRWWRSRVGPDGPRDGVDPRVLLAEAQDRFAATVRIQGQARMLLQAALKLLAALARRAGVPDAASSLMAG
jgi:pyruvate,water dikinase